MLQLLQYEDLTSFQKLIQNHLLYSESLFSIVGPHLLKWQVLSSVSTEEQRKQQNRSNECYYMWIHCGILFIIYRTLGCESLHSILKLMNQKFYWSLFFMLLSTYPILFYLKGFVQPIASIWKIPFYMHPWSSGHYDVFLHRLPFPMSIRFTVTLPLGPEQLNIIL